jgi:hypothetical protein
MLLSFWAESQDVGAEEFSFLDRKRDTKEHIV